jgi:hypothetical protein
MPPCYESPSPAVEDPAVFVAGAGEGWFRSVAM